MCALIRAANAVAAQHRSGAYLIRAPGATRVKDFVEIEIIGRVMSLLLMGRRNKTVVRNLLAV